MTLTLRMLWWWLSDPSWRRRYAANRRRIRSFRTAQRAAVRRILAASGTTVLAGPFAGMSFEPARRSDAYCAQVLLGTYERELHGIIEGICVSSYSLIVDIGADSGYYVCGLKRRLPDVRVVAFEAVVEKHATIRELLVQNGVNDGVTIRGLCDPAALQVTLDHQPRAVVICDIDGGEVDVLDLERVPALRQADLLIETHDSLRAGVTELLVQRFSATHDVQLLPEQPRRITDAPPEVPLSHSELLAAMDEFRGDPQAWLWMVARRERGD